MQNFACGATLYKKTLQTEILYLPVFWYVRTYEIAHTYVRIYEISFVVYIREEIVGINFTLHCPTFARLRSGHPVLGTCRSGTFSVKPIQNDDEFTSAANNGEDLGMYEEYLEKMKAGDIVILDLAFSSLDYTEITQVAF